MASFGLPILGEIMKKIQWRAILALASVIASSSYADVVAEYSAGPLHIQVVRNGSNVVAHPETSVFSSYQFLVFGGGAKVNWSGAGSLLTGIWPESNTSFRARSKDHQYSSPASIDVYAVTAKMLNGAPVAAGDYILVEQTSSYAAHPQVSAHLPAGYTLVGGGARVNWSGNGNLLYASYPNGNSWVAASKDHVLSSPATVTAYAIGVSNAFLNYHRLSVQTRQIASGTTNHPNASCTLDYGYKIIGGGAKINWTGAGGLLTASYPINEQGWYAAGKDHGVASPSSIVTYCIGIR